MINMPETKGTFFSVKYSTTIRGVKFSPSVCYKLPSDLVLVIAEMASGEHPTARIYTEEVRFVTGVAYPVKKQDDAAKKEAVEPVAAPVKTVSEPVRLRPVPVSFEPEPSSASSADAPKKPAKRVVKVKAKREFN